MSAIEIPKSIRQLAGQAIGDFTMIREGDRVLVGLSGGKDSLTLLHILLQKQRIAPVRFALGAITVDPGIEGFDPSPLKEYLKQLDIPYYYMSQPIARQAALSMEGDTLCAYCSRMKRGIMYTTARKEGYTVLALGHHLDDLAEGFLMSAFHNGSLHTLKAHYMNEEGDVRIIRPLVYVRERDTRAFAAAARLPVIPSKCPDCSPEFRVPTQRFHVKQLLAEEEKANPRLFNSLLSALRPLLGQAAYEVIPERSKQS